MEENSGNSQRCSGRFISVSWLIPEVGIATTAKGPSAYCIVWLFCGIWLRSCFRRHRCVVRPLLVSFSLPSPFCSGSMSMGCTCDIFLARPSSGTTTATELSRTNRSGSSQPPLPFRGSWERPRLLLAHRPGGPPDQLHRHEFGPTGPGHADGICWSSLSRQVTRVRFVILEGFSGRLVDSQWRSCSLTVFILDTIWR